MRFVLKTLQLLNPIIRDQCLHTPSTLDCIIRLDHVDGCVAISWIRQLDLQGFHHFINMEYLQGLARVCLVRRIFVLVSRLTLTSAA